MRPNIIAKCGGIYSSEWFWSKILRLSRVDAQVFDAAFSFVEHCDWIPAVLTGNTDPLTLKRSVCAAGHKAMFSAEWGGLPDKEFLAKLDPKLADLRDRLYSEAHTADTKAGGLCAEWAKRLGLDRRHRDLCRSFRCTHRRGRRGHQGRHIGKDSRHQYL
jgi:L-ribulokinase